MAAAERSAARRLVLVADDEPVLRSLVSAVLDGDEYVVVEAADGDDALEKARRLRPDCVLLDVMMPRRSGLDVLRALRADRQTASLRVVMLSARAQNADVDAAREAGADRILSKPFSPAELVRLVDELMAE